MSDTKEVLERLLRKIGREAARHERFAEDGFARGSTDYAEKCAGEANMLRLVQRFVREEIRKAKR